MQGNGRNTITQNKFGEVFSTKLVSLHFESFPLASSGGSASRSNQFMKSQT